jgi:transcriptional regulator with XRE-family HTH domain
MRLDRLREWREYKGVTQEELSARSGVSRDGISNYETGQRSARRHTAERIARALGLEVDALMTPPLNPKVPAPLLNLTERQRGVLLRLVASKGLPPVPGGSDLRDFAAIMRAASGRGMSSEEFKRWYRETNPDDVREELLPEEWVPLGEQVEEVREKA